MPNVFEVMAAGGAFDSVLQERRRQDAKHGNESTGWWITILAQVFNELYMATLEKQVANSPHAMEISNENIRDAAVRMAAAAIAIIESIDRGKVACAIVSRQLGKTETRMKVNHE